MAKFGSPGKLLRVDLSSGTLTVDPFDEAWYRQYPGGKALSGALLLREVPPHTDPLSPQNVLILAAGVLTGSPIATATRFTASARSPLTNAYGESEAGGFWGPELKLAGFEAIVVTGRAPQPVYLWVQDGQAEIRPAEHLWGRHPHEVEPAIRAELGDERIRVLQIGRGGENLVRYAGLTNELRHFNGRNGMGAVMGSKNLKAIAVRGHGRYLDYAADPKQIAALGKRFSKEAQEHPLSLDLHIKGTPGLVDGLNAGGILPTLNFRQGAFGGVDQIRWDAYEKNLLTARRTCYACAVRCKRAVAINGQESTYGGPEYEAVAAFGSDCGVDDLQAIARANELCNQYTLDAISCGATIAFAMECFEHGLLTLEDTGGLDLRFGNALAMLALVEQIANRQGLGDLLAEGSRRAAEQIGGEAPFFAIQVKGQELAMHDPRGKPNVGIGYAISEIGADHLVTIHDTMVANSGSVAFQGARDLGVQEALPARSLGEAKASQFFIYEQWISAEKAIGLCFFGPAPRSFMQVPDVIAALRAATGWELDLAEVQRIGERATNLARLFNAREGFTRQDDTLPERVFQPLENGALAGTGLSKDAFEDTLSAVYRLKGWDPETGQPLRPRLDALGLGWAADLAGIA